MTIKNVICDIDGVLMHDNVAVPGAAEFLHGIMDKGLPLVLLTNYPSQTGQDLANRFATAVSMCRIACFIPLRWRLPISCVARKARKRMWWAKAH